MHALPPYLQAVSTKLRLQDITNDIVSGNAMTRVGLADITCVKGEDNSQRDL